MTRDAVPRRAIALTAALAAGAFAVAGAARPAERQAAATSPAVAVASAGSTPRSGPPATTGAPPAYTVTAIRYATIPGFPLNVLVVGAPEGERIDIAMAVWLLRGGDRTVLVDAGFHRAPWAERFGVIDYLRPDEAVRLAGVEPEDVTDIVVTHAHWDHMGGIDLFPAATVWIQAEEYAYYTGAAWQEGGNHGGIDGADLHELLRRNTQGTLRLVPGDDVEILPGLRVLTGARHTRASQYVLVERAGAGADAGPLVIASDNAYLYRNLRDRRPVATFAPVDSTANLEAQRRMLRLAGGVDAVVPGHDPAVFERFGGGARLARIR